MSREVFELAILLSLKDAASGGLDRFEGRLRDGDKEARAYLKTFQDLRKDLRESLTISGIGVGMLTSMRGGIKTAGDFEAAMADLRMSIAEVNRDGTVNIAALGDQLNRYEQLGMRLGNQLPGTTQDFIEMFATLKQGGLQSQQILDGTGQAVAHLAVVTNNVPKDLAEPFAQYAQQFQLTGKEATQLADLLARLRFATGLNPQELIEGSKFFQLRAGAPLGLSGLQGAAVSGRLLATLRSFGLEGGIGGRELGGFVGRLTFRTKEQQGALAELKKQYGITLDFFDKKGRFLGIENMFVQMEKLRKLSSEEFIKKGDVLFSAEGLAPATVMMKAGVKGWEDINARIDKVAPLQDLINEKTSTYNAKLEAVQGTLDNLKASAFAPLIDDLKPLLDLTNAWIGDLQGISKTHPEAAKLATELYGLVGITLAIAGGVKAMTTAWRMWKIISSVGVGEGGVIMLNNTKRSVDATGESLVLAGTKAGRFRGALNAIPSTVKVAVLMVGVEYAIQQLYNLYEAIEEAKAGKKAEDKATADSMKSLLSLRSKHTPEEILRADPHIYESTAAGVMESLNRGGELKNTFDEYAGLRFLKGAGRFFTFQPKAPYGDVTYDQGLAQQTFRERAPQLAVPEVMREFIKKLESMTFSSDLRQNSLAREDIFKTLQTVFPDAFAKATQGTADSFLQLVQPLKETADSMTKLPQPLDRASAAAGRAATNLDLFSFRLQTFTPSIPTPSVPVAPQVTQPPFNFQLQRQSFEVPREKEKRPQTIASALSDYVVEPRFRISSPEPQIVQPTFKINRASYDVPPATRTSESTTRSGPERAFRDIHIHLPQGTRTDDPRRLARLLAREVERQKERA